LDARCPIAGRRALWYNERTPLGALPTGRGAGFDGRLSRIICYADLHIHIGRTSADKPVKITAARDLTFENIAAECSERKGIGLAGIVDCASPGVIADIETLIASGDMIQLPGGGLRYRDAVTVILGAELETGEANGEKSHHVSYFGALEQLKDFSRTLSRHVTNLDLSSQRASLSANSLFRVTDAIGGIFIPAHSFTPHKSVYGRCVRRLHEMFSDEALDKIPAIELGLSADSYLADRIGELGNLAFVSNSDAHSLPKIAREYNVLEVPEPDFDGLVDALRRRNGARVVGNFGLDPRLGKYHRTYCEDCEHVMAQPPPMRACELCGNTEVVIGVLDRIVEIADWDEPRPPAHRPPYQYQVPLQFVPKVGTVTLNKLINRFGSEMAVLHEASAEEIALTVGSSIADLIIKAREGTLPLLPGGGGHYGKAVEDAEETQLQLFPDP
jgi:uncharacterized protein (TIGR00375 family)